MRLVQFANVRVNPEYVIYVQDLQHTVRIFLTGGYTVDITKESMETVSYKLTHGEQEGL